MLALKNMSSQRLIQTTLASGIALIVISTLFMGRGQESSSFIEQAMSALAVPTIFYAIGILVYRYLNAPLGAPGIVATGAWLIGVGIIHLNDKRNLMPIALQPYYWLAASVLAAALITWTAHRIRSWLIVPLVPLMQANALWAVPIHVRWMPVVSFLLVLIWWGLPLRDKWLRSIYRGSAAVMAVLLMIFGNWLPARSPESLMLTWAAGAAFVVIIGLQNGWLSFGPLAIVILVGASIWGLPAGWLPVTWLALAVGTLVFIERQVTRSALSTPLRAVELSRSLALLLTAGAAVFAQAAPLLHVDIHPLAVAGVVAGAGIVLIWLGLQRELLSATHGGLWLLASAWIDFYFVAVPASGLYGLWLALFAACALLVQRVATSARKGKHKGSQTILKTITSWPVADLTIGVSTIVLLWTVIQISIVDTWMLTVTLAVVIGIWIATGLLYRLPVLLHIALWVLPIPYAMLAILLAPAFWTLPLLGIAWQFLGIGLLILGHLSPRYRPQVLAPFFIVGYFLLGFGFTIAVSDPGLLPVSLTIIVIAIIATSVAVILDYHPAWTAFVQWVIQPELRPYAFRHIHHLFLFLSAWITVVWLHLMLGYAGLSLPRQGLCLVLFSCLWFVSARLLSRLPKIVVWPVIGAGWFIWLIGLLEVFYSPTEAFVTVILGLLISAESLRRTRDAFWVPVLVIQIIFTAIQIASVLALPGYLVLLLVTIVISLVGMFFERHSSQSGRAAAVTGAITALGVWALHPDLAATLLLIVLPVAALLSYRNWKFIWLIYVGLSVALVQSRLQITWQALLIVGSIQWIIGAELIRLLRPRRFRTFKRAFFLEQDYATPSIWIGSITTFIALLLSLYDGMAVSVLVSVGLAALFAVYTFRLRIFYLAYFSLFFIGFALLIFGANWADSRFLVIETNRLLLVSSGIALSAILIRWLCVQVIKRQNFNYLRWGVLWLKPLLAITYLLGGISAVILFSSGTRYVSPLALITNSLVLATFTLLLYIRKRQQVSWLWLTFAVTAYAWLILLQALGLNGPMWKTLPLGAALFILARASGKKSLEYAGSVVWLVGSVLSVDRANIVSLASLGAVIHPACLVLYGYWDGKRSPFLSGVLVLLGEVAFIVFKINPWLIPFGGGSLLLFTSLLFEVQRDAVERLLSQGYSFWQQWK